MYSLCFKLYTNYTQNLTLNPTQRALKTLHSERSQNYTRSGTQTLHFVFEHESREWNFEREWNEWSESYVTFVTNVTNVTNVKQEMAIRGDAPRPSVSSSLWLLDSSSLWLFVSSSLLSVDSSLPRDDPKIQQFWAFFQRFDINIFNLSEHFSPPNFAFSACSFALPSPN